MRPTISFSRVVSGAGSCAGSEPPARLRMHTPRTSTVPPLPLARIAKSTTRVEPSGRRNRRRPTDSPRRTCARQIASSGASAGSSSNAVIRSPVSASAERPASAVPVSFTATIRRSRPTTNIAFAERLNAVQNTCA
jgi:hypothetical protein